MPFYDIHPISAQKAEQERGGIKSIMRSERGVKKKFRLGVSGKMMLHLAVPTAVILLLLAVIVTVTVVNTVWGLKDMDIQNQMEAVSNQVTQYFDPFFVSEEFITDRISIKNILTEME